MRKIIFLTENIIDQHNENYEEVSRYNKRKTASNINGVAGGVTTGIGVTALAAGAISNPFILLGLLVAGPTMLVIKKFLKEKNKEAEYNISPDTIKKISRFSKYARKSAKARPTYNRLVQELRKKDPDESRIIELSEELKKVLKEDGFDIDKIYRDEIM